MYNKKAKIKADLDLGKVITIYADRNSASADGTVTVIPRDIKLSFQKAGGKVIRIRDGVISLISEKAALHFIWEWRKGVEVSKSPEQIQTNPF